MKILWRVDPRTYNRLGHLLAQLQQGRLTEEDWLDQVMRLPGYPLRGRPQPQDELHIEQITSTTVSVR